MPISSHHFPVLLFLLLCSELHCFFPNPMDVLINGGKPPDSTRTRQRSVKDAYLRLQACEMTSVPVICMAGGDRPSIQFSKTAILDERLPIIGANCIYHRYYHSTMTSAQTSPSAVPPSASGPSAPVVDDVLADGIDCSPCCQNRNCRRTFRGVVLGQVLSLCLCGTGVASQLLSQKGVNTPTAQSFLNYFLLCFVYGTLLSFKSGDNGLLAVCRKRGWKYFLLALLDVEANFIIVYAYQFTSLTSIQLLDCSTIPVVLVLSWLFLSVRYLVSHVIGVCVCLIGIACLIWADVLNGKGQAGGGSNMVLGDALCLSAAVLYGAGNVGEEYLVKQNSRIEYLGMIGLFGSIISGIQLAILEHDNLSRVPWSGGIIGLYLLFALSMFVFYSMVAVVMQRSSALMLNLSILTADFYTLLIGIFMFKYNFHLLYFVSFIVVITGSVCYSMRPTQRRDADEPRRFCPCLFWFCCCSSCCFDERGEGNTSDEFRSSTLRSPSFVDQNAATSPIALIRSQHQCPVHSHNSTPAFNTPCHRVQ